jgi:hypothetical protein
MSENESIRDRWIAAKKAYDTGSFTADEAAAAYLKLCELQTSLLASDEEIEFTFRDAESGVTHQIMAKTEKAAIARAREWAREGDYGEIESTIWVDVYVSQETDQNYDSERGSDEETRVTLSIDPEEPDCAEGHEHDWKTPYSVLGGLKENPGVQGHGGGAICKEVCAHCGVYKITDTWAQRPDNGEQGLRSVSYEEADDDSLAWIARRKRKAMIAALTKAGYDTDTKGEDCVYIRNFAPDSSDPKYDCDGEDDSERTAPGSKWDEDCDALREEILEIVKPHGFTADWSDDDLRIEVA